MSSAPERPFGALLTAMVTPFSADGALDLAGAQQLAEHLIATGHDGIVVSGTTGESPVTTDGEKLALLRAVIEAAAGRAKIVAGVGSNDTRHTIEAAESAAKAGADGLLVVTPYYNKPPASSLLAHFTAVADATDVPVMLYDIPGRAGVRIGTPVLRSLAEHPRIAAVKDATGDLSAGVEVMAETGLVYYSGDDALNLAWLAVGASGLVSVVSQIDGGPDRDMIAAVDAGDLATARAIDRQSLPLIRVIMNARSQGAIRAKAALQSLGVIGTRTTRLPLLPADAGEVEEIVKVLAARGLDRVPPVRAHDGTSRKMMR